MADTTFVSGALLALSESKDGEHTVEQVEHAVQLPKVVEDVASDRLETNYSYGPVKITGYVIKSTLEIGVEASVLGIKLGNFYGNVKDGLKINIKLFVATGYIRFYLKNGKEVWVQLDVEAAGKKSDTDHKLLTV